MRQYLYFCTSKCVSVCTFVLANASLAQRVVYAFDGGQAGFAVVVIPPKACLLVLYIHIHIHIHMHT